MDQSKLNQLCSLHLSLQELATLRLLYYASWNIHLRSMPDASLTPSYIPANYLKQLASIVEMNVPNVSIEIQECPVVESILNTVSKSEIDLIVMSTIGQDHNTWMMGAIANRILREAPVPVILIRKKSWVLLPDPPRHHQVSKQEEAWIHPSTLSY
jgi:nucleotide-binding universal stress UspA family protein